MGRASRSKAERKAAREALSALNSSPTAAPPLLDASQPDANPHDQPTNGLSLRLTSRSEDYGDFHTGLLFIGASTSDGKDREGSRATVRVRDIVAAVPVLWWRLETELTRWQGSPVLEAAGYMQSKALGATLLENHAFPMNSKRTEAVGFRVKGETVRLISDTINAGVFSDQQFKIDPRLAFFLALSQTLSVVIETPASTYVSTITADGGAPRQVMHDGTAHMSSLDKVVRKSTRWEVVHVGNPSILADAHDTPDHHRRTYSATSGRTDLPDRLSKRRTCLACGKAGDSREHCVPKWIAFDQQVTPVVAPLFCVACNNYFGETLEVPISEAYRAGLITSSLDQTVLHQWALKTALLLSAASDVQVDDTWMAELRAGRMPVGFQIFALTDASMEPGYIFSVTHFSRAARDAGQFLFSFAMRDLLFVVLRHSEDLQIAGLQRVLPRDAPVLRLSGLDVADLHDQVMEQMTGHAMARSDTALPIARANGDRAAAPEDKRV